MRCYVRRANIESNRLYLTGFERIDDDGKIATFSKCVEIQQMDYYRTLYCYNDSGMNGSVDEVWQLRAVASDRRIANDFIDGLHILDREPWNRFYTSTDLVLFALGELDVAMREIDESLLSLATTMRVTRGDGDQSSSSSSRREVFYVHLDFESPRDKFHFLEKFFDSYYDYYTHRVYTSSDDNVHDALIRANLPALGKIPSDMIDWSALREKKRNDSDAPSCTLLKREVMAFFALCDNRCDTFLLVVFDHAGHTLHDEICAVGGDAEFADNEFGSFTELWLHARAIVKRYGVTASTSPSGDRDHSSCATTRVFHERLCSETEFLNMRRADIGDPPLPFHREDFVFCLDASSINTKELRADTTRRRWLFERCCESVNETRLLAHVTGCSVELASQRRWCRIHDSIAQRANAARIARAFGRRPGGGGGGVADGATTLTETRIRAPFELGQMLRTEMIPYRPVSVVGEVDVFGLYRKIATIGAYYNHSEHATNVSRESPAFSYDGGMNFARTVYVNCDVDAPATRFVMCIDVDSMYPSVLELSRCDPDRMIDRSVELLNRHGYDRLRFDSARDIKSRFHIFTRRQRRRVGVYERLIRSNKRRRRQFSKPYAKVLKLVSNSCYGAFSAKHNIASASSCHNMSRWIAARGMTLWSEIVEWMQSTYGAVLLYGDTDSFMFDVKMRENCGAPTTSLTKRAATVLSELNSELASAYDGVVTCKLEFVADRFLCVGNKQYAYREVENGTIASKGMTSGRSDVHAFTKIFETKLLEMIFGDGDASSSIGALLLSSLECTLKTINVETMISDDVRRSVSRSWSVSVNKILFALTNSDQRRVRDALSVFSSDARNRHPRAMRDVGLKCCFLPHVTIAAKNALFNKYCKIVPEGEGGLEKIVRRRR